MTPCLQTFHGWMVIVVRFLSPKSVKKASRALTPFDNIQNAVAGSLATLLRSLGKRKGWSPVFKHGNCPVNHRTPQAAARCKNL